MTVAASIPQERGNAMPLQFVTVACLADNYAFLLQDGETGTTALVDAPEAAPVIAELGARGWRLDLILLTHHHDDHIGAVAALRAAFPGLRVIGAAADAHRLPPLDLAVAEGDTVRIGAQAGSVIDVPGHTVGHVAYHFPDARLAFTGDSLMAMGCGRLFEGTAAQMWGSLSKLAALPAETLICSGHEYTAANAAFALSIDPENPALRARADQIAAARGRGEFTVPSRLSDECATNPFLRASDPAFKAAMGMAETPDAEVFAHVRRLKDRF